MTRCSWRSHFFVREDWKTDQPAPYRFGLSSLRATRPTQAHDGKTSLPTLTFTPSGHAVWSSLAIAKPASCARIVPSCRPTSAATSAARSTSVGA